MIVCVDIGQREGVKARDLFIVYRPLEMDRQLYDLPPEALKLQGRRTRGRQGGRERFYCARDLRDDWNCCGRLRRT